MAEVDDGYDTYYAERLWQLLPAVYRTADTDSFTAPGPLRELLNRIGAQVAVVRRSIDRLWADQSIETCDDWVIPYIGDLLGTNLVGNLDARAQRLDVAKTIHYRRRKGTLAGPGGAGAGRHGLDRARRRGLPAPRPHPARPRPGHRAGRLPAGERRPTWPSCCRSRA